MSYDEHDAALDAMYEQIGRELYPDHKVQAIGEFAAERLRSYYVANPRVMRPAVESLQEGKRLAEARHYAAAVVFFTSAVELFLKTTLLKPVVHGLIHSDGLADIVVQHALGQTGFDRYTDLLARLFAQYASIEIKTISRTEADEPLLVECTALQRLRNQIIHQGATCTEVQASKALLVSVAVYDLIVVPMLFAIGLTVIEEGAIQERQF